VWPLRNLPGKIEGTWFYNGVFSRRKRFLRLSARLNFDRFDRDAIERIVVRVSGLRADFVERFHSLDHMRKNGVVAVQIRYWFQANIKLAAAGSPRGIDIVG